MGARQEMRRRLYSCRGHSATKNPRLEEIDFSAGIGYRFSMKRSPSREPSSGLTPSLLAKAFRGQLVPPDPNDEPASVLMGHITQSQFLVKQTER
jgi:hypothetical protein